MFNDKNVGCRFYTNQQNKFISVLLDSKLHMVNNFLNSILTNRKGRFKKQLP